MNQKKITEILEKNLIAHVNQIAPKHNIKDVYLYATTPPGKLFRPLLMVATAQDFSPTSTDSGLGLGLGLSTNASLAYLASAVEMHHAYSLVHDDLPSMDNDDFRRGKPSTHKAFSEWEAILVGDGLLNGSYALISKASNNVSMILKIFAWALGPKGLIQGQVIDLSNDMRENFSNLIKAHELKTARLIQVSLLLGFFSLEKPRLSISKYRSSINLAKIGKNIGIAFQLIDDLTELTEELNEHEALINPWINFTHEAEITLTSELKKYSTNIAFMNLGNVNKVITSYLFKMSEKIKTGRDKINQNITKNKTTIFDLEPIISLLDSIASNNNLF